MSAVIVALADGLAAEINAHDFDTDFEFAAVRSWADFDVKLEDDVTGLRVDIIPAELPLEEVSTREDGHDQVTVDIGLRYKFPRTDTQENDGRIDADPIDALADLHGQIVNLLRSPSHKRLTNYDPATFNSLRTRVLAARNYLREHRQFLSIIRVTYDIYQEQ